MGYQLGPALSLLALALPELPGGVLNRRGAVNRIISVMCIIIDNDHCIIKNTVFRKPLLGLKK